MLLVNLALHLTLGYVVFSAIVIRPSTGAVEGSRRPELFVADRQTNMVLVLDPYTGAPLRTVGSGRGNGSGQMRNPIGLALRECLVTKQHDESLQPMGVVYVSDKTNHRIQVYNADTGEFLMTIGLGEGP